MISPVITTQFHQVYIRCYDKFIFVSIFHLLYSLPDQVLYHEGYGIVVGIREGM